MKYVRTFLYKYDGDEKVKNWQWFLVLMNSYKGIKAVYIKMEKCLFSMNFNIKFIARVKYVMEYISQQYTL